jgi:hypothetical protein
MLVLVSNSGCRQYVVGKDARNVRTNLLIISTLRLFASDLYSVRYTNGQPFSMLYANVACRLHSPKDTVVERACVMRYLPGTYDNTALVAGLFFPAPQSICCVGRYRRCHITLNSADAQLFEPNYVTARNVYIVKLRCVGAKYSA